MPRKKTTSRRSTTKKAVPPKRKPAKKVTKKVTKKATKKVTKKATPKKKAVPKKKPTTKRTTKKKNVSKRKTSPKAKKTTKTSKATRVIESSEEISIGLLQHEVDEILDTQSTNKTDRQLEQTIIKELSKILPTKEVIRPVDKKNPTTLTVTNTDKRNQHSPFVLDLSNLIEKKRKHESQKRKVHEIFNQAKELHHRFKKAKVRLPEITVTPEPIAFEMTAPTKKIILAEHEEPIPLEQAARKLKKQEASHDQFTQAPWYYQFNLPIKWHRRVIVYVMMCLLVVLPVKVFGHYQEIQKSQTQIINYATSAYADLKVASQELSSEDAEGAEARFAAANQSFVAASQELDGLNVAIKAIAKLIPTDGPNLSDAEYLLDAGEQVATLGQSITSVMDTFKQHEGPLTEKITVLQDELNKTVPNVDQLNNDLHKVRPEAIPGERLEQFNQAKSYISLLNQDLKELNSFTKSLNQILGVDYKRRYLFVFQNNNELRPTGGFLGSFALVDIDRGAITNMEIPGGGTYDMQGSLLKKRVAPYQLHLVNPLWEMQDANWFPDFPTSAQKIKWFYENAGGPSVDGVIAINASLLPQILEVTGPVYLASHNKTFTADNLVEELQRTIEIEYNNKEENTPKKVLSELAPLLLEKIFASDTEQILKLATTLKQGLNQREIQMYFTNESVQSKIQAYGWTGEMMDTAKDYLSVINTNIGGGKTDAYIKQNIDVVTDIYATGEIVNTVTITRQHTGSINDPFGKTSNVDYLRLYTPEGSQLLASQGFADIPPEAFEQPAEYWETDEQLNSIQGPVWVDPDTGTYINNEFDKTVFGNWVQTDPGETTTVMVKYQLPIKFNIEKLKEDSGLFNKKDKSTFHSLYLQKQSGEKNTNYNVTINLPEEFTTSWSFPPELSMDTKSISFSEELTEDQLIAVVIE